MAIKGAVMWIRVFICNPPIQNCPRRHSCRPTFQLLSKTRIATLEVLQNNTRPLQVSERFPTFVDTRRRCVCYPTSEGVSFLPNHVVTSDLPLDYSIPPDPKGDKCLCQESL